MVFNFSIESGSAGFKKKLTDFTFTSGKILMGIHFSGKIRTVKPSSSYNYK